MYAVPAWWRLASEGDRALIERLYRRPQRTGYLHLWTHQAPSLSWGGHVAGIFDQSSKALPTSSITYMYCHRESNTDMALVLDLKTVSSP